MGDFDFIDQILGGRKPAASKVEHGVQIRGRRVDGVYYVRAEDIVDLLEVNGALPRITAKLKAASK